MKRYIMYSLRKYDTKADMYSLGIFSFEMCHEPFATESRRIEELVRLRELDYKSLGEENSCIKLGIMNLVCSLPAYCDF